LTLNLSFSNSFAGNRVMYMAARDLEQNNSGWQALGTWTVPGSANQTAAPVSVNPSGGSSLGGTFNYTFSDSARGWQDLSVLNVLINSAIDGRQACYLAYSLTSSGTVGVLYLVDDQGDAGGPYAGSMALNPGQNGSGTIQNSQCAVNGAGSSAVGNGNTLTLTLNLIFTIAGTFGGNEVVYLGARDLEQDNSGWQALGTWDVTASVITTLEGLRNCIGAQGGVLGYTSTCQLAPNLYQSDPSYPAYSISDTLTIGRSGITIIGLITSGPADVTLRRTNALMKSIMAAASTSITDVTITELTFDGNRYAFGTGGAGLSCLLDQLVYRDLSLADMSTWPHPSGGTFIVQSVDFINAPDTALVMAGNSTVSYSNFGQGGAGVLGANGSAQSESGPQTATRFTAVYLDGSYPAGAWSNNISYAGTAGITLSGTNQTAYGNQLFGNRYEVSDGSGGGQLTLWNNASYSSVAANTIDGNSQWPPAYIYQTQGYTFATGCPITPLPPNRQTNGGVEASGIGIRFYNNEITATSGSGMAIGVDAPTQEVTVSSSNPWNSNDTPRFIEAAADDGIVVVGGLIAQPAPNPPAEQHVQGITFDNIRVRNNAGYGVSLYYAQDYSDSSGSFTGFVNGSCMNTNAVNNPSPYKAQSVGQNPCATLPGSSWFTLPLGHEGTNLDKEVFVCTNSSPSPQPTNYVPANFTSCPSESSWSSQAPPPSGIVDWPWVVH